MHLEEPAWLVLIADATLRGVHHVGEVWRGHDVLSDVAAMLTGSLGMLPSASLGAPDNKTGKRKALYEPVHGSAPDIAGKGIANPIAMIASFAMALRYSFGMGEAADRLEAAISSVLDAGLRTGDIYTEGTKKVGTRQMGDAIIKALG